MTPLVLVHGFMGGSAQWHQQDPLADKRPVIALDLPGFGANADLPALSNIEDFADWALADLSAQGVDHFDLLGHSMGGMVVQEMTHRAPERIRNLVLYGTGPLGAMPGRFETLATSMQRARDDGAEATARRISALWFQAREADPEYPACAALATQAQLEAILGGLDAMRKWSGAAYLPQMSTRTLVLWGDQDRAYPWPQVAQLWQSIADSQLAVVPGCSHMVHAEAPAIFNALVERFLDA